MFTVYIFFDVAELEQVRRSLREAGIEHWVWDQNTTQIGYGMAVNGAKLVVRPEDGLKAVELMEQLGFDPLKTGTPTAAWQVYVHRVTKRWPWVSSWPIELRFVLLVALFVGFFMGLGVYFLL